jgi:iron-sulfur cluster assembly protein
MLNSNMITITEQAANKIQENLARRGHGLGIRLGVRTTGCSGLAYVLEYVDKPAEQDMSFVDKSVHIFVDPKSLAYLEGVEIAYVRKGLNEGFEFINPQERDRCGCGESFRV